MLLPRCLPKVGESSCQELAELAAEVALKLGLRTGAVEFAQLLGGWQATPLHLLDLAELEETVARWVLMHAGVSGLPVPRG